MIATIRENEPITNNTMLEKSRNTSIDIMRLVMAILVVSIHTEPLSEFHSVLGFFATEIIPRAAVPFFFAISGYYFYGKQDLKSQFKAIYKVVLLYCLVSVVFWATDFSMKVLCQEARVCANDIFGYLAGKKFGFLISGSWYHLWYFPALIYSMVICSVLQKLRLKNLIYPLSCILYIIGVIGCAYYAIAIQIPILKVIYDNQFFEIIRRIFCMGFPFFSLGLFTRQVKLGGGGIKNIY